MSPSDSDQALLQAFVDGDDLGSAIALCEERLGQLPGDSSWKYQLGLLLFLDDMGPRWYECIEPLRQASEQMPSHLMAQFWYAYALLILMPSNDAEHDAEAILRRILEAQPNHPYVNLVLASGVAGDEESIGAVRRVLSVQPDNRRALVHFGKLLIASNRPSEAQPLLERAIGYKPYVETRHGIMNKYMTEVLCGANSGFVTDEAWELLGGLDAR